MIHSKKIFYLLVIISFITVFLIEGITYEHNTSAAADLNLEQSLISNNEIIDEAAIKENIEFRKKFGLKSELNYVLSLLKDDSIKKSSHAFGVLLTEVEQEELNNRIEFQDKIVKKVKETFKGNKSFGTVYVDQGQGGIIRVGLTNSKEFVKSEIKEIIEFAGNNSDKIEFFETKYSEEILKQTHQNILSDIEKVDGITFTSVQTNVVDGVVEVAIKEFNPENIDKLNTFFNSEMVKIVEGKESSDTSRTTYTRPLVGGLRIVNSISGSGCTGAFQRYHVEILLFNSRALWKYTI